MIQQNGSFCIAICDDERQDSLYIKELTHEILQTEHIDSDISCYDSGHELLEAIQSGKLFDLLLLDVIMPQQDGLKLASYLRDGVFEGDIVFISVNREMALHGYEVEAKRYLQKPINAEYLREALLYCYNNKQRNEVLIPIRGGMRRVRYNEIRYIETKGRGCRMVLEKEEIITSRLISEFETVCSDRCFIRCHQGFIVNFQFVQELKNSGIVLSGGGWIPVSKHRIKQVRQKFLAFLS